MVILVIHVFATQTIYSKNSFAASIFLALAVPLIFCFLAKNEIKLLVLNFGLVPFYHILLLLIIKKNYKRLNNYFIRRRFIDDGFEGKDYTFVFDGDFDTIWDEELASKPSMLDHILTLLIICIPILIVIILNAILENGR